jgi:acetylornithine/N-succinyldiaminopimelate aminotransferase
MKERVAELNKRLVNNVDRFDFEIVKGEGARLWDSEGNVYYDLWNDEAVASLGYGEVFRQAAQEFIDANTPHRLAAMYPNAVRSAAAEALCSRYQFDKVFFCSSGAEGNEACIKMARRYMAKVRNEPNRYFIVTLEGNFHGRTGFALAASDSTDSPYHKEGYAPFAGGFGVITEEEVIKAANGDTDALPRVNSAPFVPNDKSPKIQWSSVAALHFAPILGNNVVKTYSPEFWAAVEKLRAKHNILISYDEIQVANGRTGYYAAWQDPRVGVKPDLECIGKGLALGMPAAALLMTEEVHKAFVPGVHFATFGESAIFTHHLMLKLMHFLDNNLEKIRHQAQMISNYFAERDWVESYDGAGVHWGFKPGSQNFDGFKFSATARKHGLLMVTHRQYGIIRFTPPLSITDEELLDIFARLDATAAEASAQ